MAQLDSLDADHREAVCEHLARLKHDLGKYVAFQQRWLPEGATDRERREALVADLLETRRGPEGTVDALSVWSTARPALYGEQALRDGIRVSLADEPLVAQLDKDMEALGEVIAALRAGTDTTETLDIGTKLALAVADACKNLVARARGGRRPWLTS